MAKAEVCKTSIRRFDSGRRLQSSRTVMARYILALFILLCSISLGISAGLLAFAAGWSEARGGFLRDVRGLVNGLAMVSCATLLFLKKRKA